MAWPVRPSGRVCGTAIGMPCTLTVSRTPNRRTSPITASSHALPLVVRLLAGQQQEGVPRAVHDPVQQQRRVGVGDPPVAVEDHSRAPAAVVEQLVDVEGRNDGAEVGGEQVAGQHALGVTGVDETAQGDNEHRGIRGIGVAVGLEAVELRRVKHGSGLSSVVSLVQRSSLVAHSLDGPLDTLGRHRVCRAEGSGRTATPAAPRSSTRWRRRRRGPARRAAASSSSPAYARSTASTSSRRARSRARSEGALSSRCRTARR